MSQTAAPNYLPTSPNRPDARAWVLWALATAILTILTRNPLYVFIILLATQLVSLRWQYAEAPLKLPLWRLALVIISFSTLFNLLFVHLGQTTLLTLPEGWPLLGGGLTLESAIYGATNGLMLLTLLVVFMTFSSVVPGGDLIYLTPRLFHSLGLVLLIALTYVPETRRHWQQIREAQAIRGHALHGWRDLRPVLLPLLVGGLERALSLAEVMVARGYGATAETRQPLLAQLILLLGLGATFSGWLLGYWLGWPGWVLLGSGVLILLLLMWALGERNPARRYAERQWGWREGVLAATAVVPLLCLLIPWPFLDRSSLYYTPYPQASLPPFDPIIGLALAVLGGSGIFRIGNWAWCRMKV